MAELMDQYNFLEKGNSSIRVLKLMLVVLSNLKWKGVQIQSISFVIL